jgi:hypothetical protein
LSFGGVSLQSRVLSLHEPVPAGDRVGGALVGWTLVSIAALIEVGSSQRALWALLGAGSLATVGYSLFLIRTRPRG